MYKTMKQWIVLMLSVLLALFSAAGAAEENEEELQKLYDIYDMGYEALLLGKIDFGNYICKRKDIYS